MNLSVQESLRKTIACYLDDLESPVGKVVNFAIAVFVLASSGIFVAQTYAIPPDVRAALNAIDDVILAIFSIEYLLRFWCADNKRQFIFSFYAAIDLVAILPFFLVAADTSFLRLLRWFRFLRLIRLVRNKALFGRFSDDNRFAFARILFTLSAIVFVFSGLIYQVEHAANPKDFRTFLDAFYFSIFTMTTVGYGDVTPTSESGRLLTVLMVLTGIALIPLQLGQLIERLVKPQHVSDRGCPTCGLQFHDGDARFCKACGTRLPDMNNAG